MIVAKISHLYGVCGAGVEGKCGAARSYVEKRERPVKRYGKKAGGRRPDLGTEDGQDGQRYGGRISTEDRHHGKTDTFNGPKRIARFLSAGKILDRNKVRAGLNRNSDAAPPRIFYTVLYSLIRFNNIIIVLQNDTQFPIRIRARIIAGRSSPDRIPRRVRFRREKFKIRLRRRYKRPERLTIRTIRAHNYSDVQRQEKNKIQKKNNNTRNISSRRAYHLREYIRNSRPTQFETEYFFEKKKERKPHSIENMTGDL